MKNIITFLFLIITTILFAQVPQGISYQAVAFDTSGDPVTSSSIGIKISVLEGSISGTAIYEETHTKNTNAQGLFNLHIGQGTAITGDFSSIDWGNTSKFLKVEIDPNGGTTYTSTGTSELMSVPYALYAENVNVSKLAQTIKTGSQTSTVIVTYTDTEAYAFSQYNGGNGNWTSRSLTGNVLGAVASDNAIVIYTDTEAYAFSQYDGGNGNWTSRSLTGNVLGAISSKNNIVVYTDSNAYAFSQFDGGNGNWTSRSLTGTPTKTASSNNSIVVCTTSEAYAFSQFNGGNGNWTSRSLSGTFMDVVGSSISIVVTTTSNAYAFSQFNGGNGNWTSRSLTGNLIDTISR